MKTPKHPMRGLGDLIAKVADPIARAIGLDKAKCGCAKRQEALNKAVPFELHPQPTPSKPATSWDSSKS